MKEIFSPQVRGKAITTTCSNFIMAGLLQPSQVASYMTQLASMNNYQLAEQMVTSRLFLDNYLETTTSP